MNLTEIAKIASTAIHQNMPTILTATALTATVVAVCEAYKHGDKIKEVIAEKRQDLRDTATDDKETRRVVVFECVRDVIPSVLKIVIPTIVATVSIFSLNKVHEIRYAGAAALAMASQKELQAFKESVKEIVPPKKVTDIESSYATKLAQEEPKMADPQPYDRDGFVVYDPKSGYKFHVGAVGNLIEARSKLNDELSGNNVPFVSIERFYELASGHFVHVPFAEEWGWNQGEGNVIDNLDWHLGGDNEGNPCWVLDYRPQLEKRSTFGDLAYYR